MSLPGEEKYNGGDLDLDQIIEEVTKGVKAMLLKDLEPVAKEMAELLEEVKKLSIKLAALEAEQARQQSWLN